MTPREDIDPAPPNPPDPDDPPVFIDMPPCDHVGFCQLKAGAGEGSPTNEPPSGVSE